MNCISQQQQWRHNNNPHCSSIRRIDTAKKEQNPDFFSHCFHAQEDYLKIEDDKKNVYQSYGGKFRKSAVKSNPVLRIRKSVGGTTDMFNTYKGGCEMGEQFLSRKGGRKPMFEERRKPNYNIGDNDDKAEKKSRSKEWLLEEFRRVYRQKEKIKVPKQSVRTDMLAWKEMDRRYVLKPMKTIGSVLGVGIGDTFDLRLELIIMGIHFQSIKGIDYMEMFPHGTLLATSVVATEGYEDNMIENDAIWYTGEGGNFERGCSKGALVKDQVMGGGNLALKNSMIKKTEVRVVRGIKRSQSSKPIYVYDGLYKVVACRQKTGVNENRQFEFKLVRCPAQKSIEWAKYKLLCRYYQ